MKGTIAEWERDRFHRATADAIAALPETAEPETLATEALTTGRQLAEREAGGLHVELLLTTDNRVALYLTENGVRRATFVPAAQALDAFHHPHCYIGRR